MSEEQFTIYLTNYLIGNTEADGGHRYLTTNIEYKGQRRDLTAFFVNKEDEEYIEFNRPIILKGDLLDEDVHQALLLLNAEIVIEEPSVHT